MRAIRVLREYGAAVRHDWSEIDGRSIRDGLGAIADAIEADDGEDEALRRWVGICPAGSGHWVEWCDEGCKATDE